MQEGCGLVCCPQKTELREPRQPLYFQKFHPCIDCAGISYPHMSISFQPHKNSGLYLLNISLLWKKKESVITYWYMHEGYFTGTPSSELFTIPPKSLHHSSAYHAKKTKYFQNLWAMQSECILQTAILFHPWNLYFWLFSCLHPIQWNFKRKSNSERAFKTA